MDVTRSACSWRLPLNFNVMSVDERHEETFSLRTERLTNEAFKFLLTFEQIVKSHRVLVRYVHDVVSH